jgi:hypothetical protein
MRGGTDALPLTRLARYSALVTLVTLKTATRLL